MHRGKEKERVRKKNSNEKNCNIILYPYNFPRLLAYQPATLRHTTNPTTHIHTNI